MKPKQLLFLIFSSILSLTSCSVDPETVLPGKWECSFDDRYGNLRSYSWEIEADGKFKLINNNRPERPELGTWTYDPNGQKFTINRSGKILNYYIKSIQDNSIQMELTEKDGKYGAVGSMSLKRAEE